MDNVRNAKGVLVDIDTGTVINTNVVFIPDYVWENSTIGYASDHGQATASEVIDFANAEGWPLWVD